MILNSVTLEAIMEKRLQYHLGDEVWRDGEISSFMNIARITSREAAEGAPKRDLNQFALVIKNRDRDEYVAVNQGFQEDMPQVLLEILREMTPEEGVTMISIENVRLPS